MEVDLADLQTEAGSVFDDSVERELNCTEDAGLMEADANTDNERALGSTTDEEYETWEGFGRGAYPC